MAVRKVQQPLEYKLYEKDQKGTNSVNRIRIRTTKKEREAIREQIKKLIDQRLVGEGSKYFYAGRINTKIMAMRGTRGIPKIISEDTVPYLYRQMLEAGEIIIKEDEEGKAYLVTKENQTLTPEELVEKGKEELVNQFKANVNNQEKENKNMEQVKEDAQFKKLNENKVEKSIRNTKEFMDAINRVAKGEFDEDIDDATNMPYLKVAEKWSIHKHFSLEEGKDYYQLYKEVFYIENPGKYYFETVEPTIYRRISRQHENGDIEWAKAVATHLGIKIAE